MTNKKMILETRQTRQTRQTEEWLRKENGNQFQK